MKRLRTTSAAFFAFFLSTLAAFAGDPTGTWKFKAEGPGGRSVDSTLSLNWENNQLTGAIDNRAGKAEIVNAHFVDDRVTFSVMRAVRRRKITVNYDGKLDGDTIKGTLQTKGRGDKQLSLPWEANRSK